MGEIRRFFFRNSLLLVLLAASVLVHTWLILSRLSIAQERVDPKLYHRQRGHTSVSVQLVASKEPAAAALAQRLDVPFESPLRAGAPPEIAPVLHHPLEGGLSAVLSAAPAQSKRRNAQRHRPASATSGQATKIPRHTPKVPLVPLRRLLVSHASSGADVPASYLTRPDPVYPRELLLEGIEGRVELLVEVGTGGRPLSVIIHKSSGHRPMDQSAVEAVRRWRFSPARRGAVAVAGKIIVPVRFKIRRGP